jgi:hypothetical protein
MKYMLLLFEPETDWQSRPDELRVELARHQEFIDWMDARGIPHSGEALGGQSTATTLRPVGDDLVVTDGPYAELKENLGGYYVIDVKDLDEAIEVARRCPTTTATEIRPIWAT